MLIAHILSVVFTEALIAVFLFYAVCFLDQHMKLLPKSCIRPSKTIKGLASLNYHVVTLQFAIMLEM